MIRFAFVSANQFIGGENMAKVVLYTFAVFKKPNEHERNLKLPWSPDELTRGNTSIKGIAQKQMASAPLDPNEPTPKWILRCEDLPGH